MKGKGLSTENSATAIMTQQANEKKKYTLLFQFNTERTNLVMEHNYSS